MYWRYSFEIKVLKHQRIVNCQLCSAPYQRAFVLKHQRIVNYQLSIINCEFYLLWLYF